MNAKDGTCTSLATGYTQNVLDAHALNTYQLAMVTMCFILKDCALFVAINIYLSIYDFKE